MTTPPPEVAERLLPRDDGWQWDPVERVMWPPVARALEPGPTADAVPHRLPHQIQRDTVHVTLTPAEIYECIDLGARRHEASAGNRKRNFVGNGAFDARIDIHGMMGEFALAKWLNTAHDVTVNTFRKRNVAGVYAVKASAYQDAHLVVRGKDPAGAVGVLAIVCTHGGVDLVGWIAHDDARRPTWWGSLNGSKAMAWNVPQAALRPMAELPGRSS